MKCIKVLRAIVALASVGAHASTITYTLEYSGALFGNGATATGTVTLDTTLLPNEELNFFGETGDALGGTAFEITVAGASSGNGTFTQDVLGEEGGRWVWTLNSAIDLTTELVGQAGFVDFNWLCEINNAECNDPLVPQGVNVLTIQTAGGEQLLMTSMRPVPLPGALWLFGSALAGLAIRRRAVATF